MNVGQEDKMIDFSQTKMIFEHLQDEMSRTIFEGQSQNLWDSNSLDE